MRQVAAFAFRRSTTAWLLITRDELGRLNGLEAWTMRLFGLLVMCSDFQTGNGRTGYGELITGLTPDQPAAGRRLWVPTRNDVKKALYSFEALGLVRVDREASEARKALFFRVDPRTRTGTPAKKLNPELHPTSTQVKQGRIEPLIAPGVSETRTFKTAREEAVDNSVRTARVDALRALRGRIAARG